MSKEKNELMVGGEAFDTKNAAAYLEQVKTAITDIKGVEEEDQSIVGKSIPGFGELKDVSDTSMLIQAYSSIKGRMNAYDAAAKDMGLKGKKLPKFKVEGVSGDKWLAAIIRREAVVTSADKLAKLEEAKGIFTSMLSEEDKAKAKIQDLAGILAELGA